MNNAILIGPCKSRVPIDGSLSNAFEYFYFTWLINKNILLIIDTTKESLEIVKKYLKIKYKINENCLNNIIIYEKKFLFLKNLFLFEMISIDNFQKYNFLKYKKLFALSGSKNHKLHLQINVEYFIEYEHLAPIGFIPNYKSKLFFEILKEPKSQDNKVFINTRDPNYIKKENEITRQDINIMKNIFEYFNKMIYIQHPTCFDVKPRLFQECQYFNIPYEFISHKDCFDGANLRANDYDLKSRFLTRDDPIINILLEH